jgi:tripartite-type tricarboxylate transporter receptor subunit TctC
MNLKRLVACAALVFAPLATAQTWPSKPVRIITPYPGGSGTDTYLRALGQELTKSWGQAVLVDNRPGASTIIAGDTCAKAAPDGYTICMLDRTLSILPHLYRKLPFDTERDFTPIVLMANLVAALEVHPAVPANSFDELIAYARANPGKLNYSTPGEGTPPHLMMEWIKNKYGVNLVHIPFKSPPEIVQTLMSGQIQVSIFGLINMLGPIRAGKVKALAVSGASRSPLIPDVPTFAEVGAQGFDDRLWFALFGPAGLPKAVVDRASRDVLRIIAQPAFRKERMVDQGWEPVGSGPEELANLVKHDRAVAGEMVRISGAKVKD